MPPCAVRAAAESARQSAPWWARYGLTERDSELQGFGRGVQEISRVCAAEVFEVRLQAEGIKLCGFGASKPPSSTEALEEGNHKTQLHYPQP